MFIKNFPVFVLPKPDRKYSHTYSHICSVKAITQDDHRSLLELGPTVVSGKLRALFLHAKPRTEFASGRQWAEACRAKTKLFISPGTQHGCQVIRVH